MPLTFNSVANMQSSMKKYDFDLAQVKKEGFTVSDKHYLLKGYHLISTQLTSVSNTASAISSSPHQDTEVIKSFQNYIEDFQKLNSLAEREPLSGNQLKIKQNVTDWLRGQHKAGNILDSKHIYELFSYTHRGTREGVKGFPDFMNHLRNEYKAEVQNFTFNDAVRYGILEIASPKETLTYVKTLLTASEMLQETGAKMNGENLVETDIQGGKVAFRLTQAGQNSPNSANLIKDSYASFQRDMITLLNRVADEHNHPIDAGKSSATASGATASGASNLQPTTTVTQKYSEKEVENWLFNGNNHAEFPQSQLVAREQTKYAPKISFNSVPILGGGKYTSRIGIYSGGITDLKVGAGQTAAVGDSNNGDLLTGCGYAVAKAIVNAAGAGLQAELYNRFGVPEIMGQPQYGKDNYSHTEGRGYAITCDSYDMVQTHGINQIELLTVPMRNVDGLKNMYREALSHAKDRDYIALPMAGMSHPLLDPAQGGGGPELSARIATEAVKEFVKSNPGSKLKVIFTIFNDQNSEKLYEKYAKKL